MDEAQKQVTMFKWAVSAFLIVMLTIVGGVVASQRWTCQCKASECLLGKPCPAKVGCKDCAGCCDPCACKDCGCKGCGCKKEAGK